MEVAGFLELLIDASEEALAHRWRELKANPTKYFQSRSGQSAADWRAGRKGLNPAAKFGAFDPTSNNFAFLSGTAPDGTPKDTVSRREFYDACWPPLIATYQSTPPRNNDLASWTTFRDLLRSDQSPLWPPTTPIKSSAFVTQFTIDVLRTCLGQRNAALTDPAWQRAVLIEVGENRTPKNAYTVEQAKAAVDAFLKLIPA
jgi:hypothetical protein